MARSRARNRRRPRSVVPVHQFWLKAPGGGLVSLDAFTFMDLVQLMRVERSARDPRVARLKAQFDFWFDQQLNRVRFRVRFPKVDPHPPRTSWRGVERAEMYAV